MAKPIFIGIGGGTASGKTSVATQLSKISWNVVVISLDHFYLECPEGTGESHNWDAPSSFDWDLFLKCMKEWKQGANVWIPKHDFANYKRIDNAKSIPAARIMMFEGIHIFHHEAVSKLFDLKVFVDCDSDEALCRRVLRDMSERGYTIETILNRYQTHVKPAYDRWILPTKNSADIVLVNNRDKKLTDHRGIDILITYIKSKLDDHDIVA